VDRRNQDDFQAPAGSGVAVTAAAVVAGLVVVALAAVPVLEARGGWGAGAIRACFAAVCHQAPDRSLQVGGGSMAVCARCTGLYLGGFAGLVLASIAGLARRRWHPAWLAALAAPTLVDASLGLAGLPSLPVLPRMILTLPAGLAAGVFLAVGIADLAAMARPLPRRLLRRFP
jgi:uncharacterized membrane protein